MDELIEDGLKVVSYAEREPYYHEIQEIFVEEQPVLNLQFDEWMNVFQQPYQGSAGKSQEQHDVPAGLQVVDRRVRTPATECG